MVFFKKSFSNQIMVLTVVLLLLPIAITFYMLHVIRSTEQSMLETHKKNLTKAVTFLDNSFPSTFDEILKKHHAEDLTRREKVILLNRELKPIIDQAKRNYPGVELGFYSLSLDVILDGDEQSYGENFSKRRKEAFDETITKNKPVVQVFGLTQGGQIEVYQPLIRNGEVIGSVWGTENLSTIYRRMNQIEVDAYGVIILGGLLGLGGAFTLIARLVTTVNQVKAGVQKLEKDLTYVLPPAPGEIGEITQAINHLATKLINAQNYNEIILASIDDGILAVDLAGNIISLNSSAMRILGLENSCLGKNIVDVFPTDSPFCRFLQDALKMQELVKDKELIYPSSNGKTLHLLVSTNLMVNIRQEIVGAVLTCRDITERTLLEEQVRRQERLAALGKLVAGVAHEIRNPLTSISGYIQYWLKDHLPTPKSLQIVHKEISRVNTIVDKLLQFSRPATAIFGSHDLNQLVRRTLQSFKDAHDCAVEIEEDLATGLPPAYMDPGQIEQVLLNILYNASQATSNRGKIRVSTAYEPQKGMLVVSVADNGPGIPEEVMPHLFEPFFTTKPKGTGLGLAIAYEIMQAHGGDIQVESKVGQGTTCHIYLPFVNQNAEAKEGQGDAHNSCGR
ncbi:two-component system sensor histidine kinase AtoS [Desulfovirgula thermocuniculi]|uniref:two-component system sensor histidine kinase AtoS n=1 Tax=Desulfovirgula thermocuniculi TaxID=348842 RepID=UPI000403EC90|nr:two-component system sensor histidine kinase AtoS [Desulfovirgula thermocuniculi]